MGRHKKDPNYKPEKPDAPLPETAAGCRSVNQRVRWIARLMSSGQWAKSYTDRCRLAETWGVTEAYVRQLASEAHRLIEFDEDELAQMRRNLFALCQDIYAEARTRMNLRTGQTDLQAALGAVDRMGIYSGAANAATHSNAAPCRVEVKLLPADEGDKPKDPK